MHCDLMSLPVHLLDGGIIRVFVRNEECSFHITTVGVLSVSIENLLVKFDVIIIDGVIEGDSYHLGYVFGWKISRYLSTVF